MSAVLSGGLGLLAILLFLGAIRLSYLIEAARRGRPRDGPPVSANIFATLIERPDDDAATMDAIRRLRLLMLLVLALMAGLALVALTAPPARLGWRHIP